MSEKSLSEMILEILCEDVIAEDKGLTGQQVYDRLQVKGWCALDNGARPTKVPYLRIIEGGAS